MRPFFIPALVAEQAAGTALRTMRARAFGRIGEASPALWQLKEASN
jgi:hypothetical protein